MKTLLALCQALFGVYEATDPTLPQRVYQSVQAEKCCNQSVTAEPNVQLYHAITHNDTNAMQEAIKAGADVNHVYKIETNYPIDLENFNGSCDKTPLIIACEHQNIEAATVLLRNGADVNKQAKTGTKRTPLISAIEYANLSMVLLLLQNGAQPNKPDGNKFTPLKHAIAMYADEQTTQRLCQGYKDFLIPTKRVGIHIARLLVAYGADVKGYHTPPITPLSCAVKSHTESTDMTAMIKFLLKNNADPNEYPQNSVASDALPLISALNNGNAKINGPAVRLLLAHGAKIPRRSYLYPSAESYPLLPDSYAHTIHTLYDVRTMINDQKKNLSESELRDYTFCYFFRLFFIKQDKFYTVFCNPINATENLKMAPLTLLISQAKKYGLADHPDSKLEKIWRTCKTTTALQKSLCTRLKKNNYIDCCIVHDDA